MPNQLSEFKRRQSLAEHESVLAALATIAQTERTSVMALLRKATREFVRRKSDIPALRDTLRREAWKYAPRMPIKFHTAAEVARFKRKQRAFDQALLDMALATPREVQARNSIISPEQAIRIVDFDQAHAKAL